MTDEAGKGGQPIRHLEEPGTPARTTDATPAATTSTWLAAGITGATGLIGVVVGGLLQYYVGHSLETDKQRKQVQLSAYADFAKAQAAWQRAQREEDASKRKTEREDAQLKINDTAFRIVIFSPAEVVKAFSAFVAETHNEECGTTQADLAVYQKMRRQMVGNDNISDQDIAMAVFGCKLK